MYIFVINSFSYEISEMKHLLLLLSFSVFSSCLVWGQSAVFAYKNIQNGRSDFMSVRNMPNQTDAEFLANLKLVELVNDDLMIRKVASTGKKGHGVVIMATVELGSGKTLSVYGAALGHPSPQIAEQFAVSNMRQMNPEWKNGKYIIVQKFKD